MRLSIDKDFKQKQKTQKEKACTNNKSQTFLKMK